jgi:hypothetical protein
MCSGINCGECPLEQRFVGSMLKTKLVVRSEEVIVDKQGYTTDENQEAITA